MEMQINNLQQEKETMKQQITFLGTNCETMHNNIIGFTEEMESMKEKGVLQVDKIGASAGNMVFVNGHTVGLSNKLNDFEGLAVRMGTYEATLAKLTASLSGKPKSTQAAEVYVPPPEYDGK